MAALVRKIGRKLVFAFFWLVERLPDQPALADRRQIAKVEQGEVSLKLKRSFPLVEMTGGQDCLCVSI